MSSDIRSSSAYTRQQFNILNSAGEDQQRAISLPPCPFPAKSTEIYFKSKQKAE